MAHPGPPAATPAVAPAEGFVGAAVAEMWPECAQECLAYGPLVRKMWEDAPEGYRLSSRLLWIGEDGIESVGVEPAPPGSKEPGVITGSARFVEMLSAFRPPYHHRG
ncbi:hypothetical protein [Streptomyces sp. NRRL S-448]|uniref:hypothetical protein n=1 Tax=Streptomyces sp. NRRL S-448 TaxID=1463907 RepID=UPI0035648475